MLQSAGTYAYAEQYSCSFTGDKDDITDPILAKQLQVADATLN